MGSSTARNGQLAATIFPGHYCLPNREAIMSKAIVFLMAAIFGLSSPALAAGKGGGGGGGQNTTSHATTQQANKPQVSNVIKTKHDTVKNSISNIR